jgi:anaerobic magnesium-protoporphyrin IX monomethyl ester cyclase
LAHIILINPPSLTATRPLKGITRVLHPVLPLGIASIGACLLREGHKVRVIDMVLKRYTRRRLLNEVFSFSPDAVGLSILGPSAGPSRLLCRILKQSVPGLFVFAGNAFPSDYPEWFLDHIPELDAVVVGEAEETVVDLFRHTPGEPVPGVLWRNQGLEAFRPREQVSDLDSLPFPAWDLFDYRRYRSSPQFLLSSAPVFGLLHGRGCPWHCRFCAQNYLWPKIRLRSFSSLVQEIKRNWMTAFSR